MSRSDSPSNLSSGLGLLASAFNYELSVLGPGIHDHHGTIASNRPSDLYRGPPRSSSDFPSPAPHSAARPPLHSLPRQE